MSSLITHVAISEILKEKYSFSDEFILGAVLPDIYKKANYTRDQTHFIIYVDHKSIPDIDKFCKEYIYNKENIELVTYGYLCHLIQDKIWFKEFIPKYAEVLKKDESIMYLKDSSIHKESEFSGEIYKDYAYVDEFAIKKYNLDINIIRENIKKYCKDENINQIIDNNFIIYPLNKDRENKFLSIEDYNEYFSRALEECDYVLNQIYINKKEI